MVFVEPAIAHGGGAGTKEIHYDYNSYASRRSCNVNSLCAVYKGFKTDL